MYLRLWIKEWQILIFLFLFYESEVAPENNWRSLTLDKGNISLFFYIKKKKVIQNNISICGHWIREKPLVSLNIRQRNKKHERNYSWALGSTTELIWKFCLQLYCPFFYTKATKPHTQYELLEWAEWPPSKG